MISQKKQLFKFDFFVFFILSCALIYYVFAWTPSSYALALEMFGVVEDGLVFGEPRPIRSDEWILFTPYVQAVVNNGFERYNETSAYREDFRNFNSLPLWDWALVFKPQYWLFFLSNPAHAFSFSHAFLMVLFLLGYYYFFQFFGFPSIWSAWGSLLLFFSGYVQIWLTTTGPLLAYFPWVVIVFISSIRPAIKVFLLIYVLTAFLLSHLYVPLIASLFFVGAISIVAFHPRKISLNNIVISLVAGFFSLLLVWLYYIDVIPIMGSTVYPGDRELSGGTLSIPMWIANFLPFFVSSNFNELTGSSIANVATSGSYLLLFLVIMVDYRLLVGRTKNLVFCNADFMRQVAILLFALTLLSIWMVFPVPASFGKVLYWHKAIAQRHVFIFGLLLVLLCFTIFRSIPLKLNTSRLMLSISIILSSWLFSKHVVFDSSWLEGYYDVLVILPLISMVVLQRLLLLKKIIVSSATLVIVSATLGNVLVFAHFNPIQSAKPIFERQETEKIAELKRLAAVHPKGWLVTEEFTGAVLNGYGFQSITHILIAPKMDFFRPFFPDLEDSAFNYIFNRYAHIQVSALLEPTLDRINVIHVPFQNFFPNIHIPQIQLRQSKKESYESFGNIDTIFISEDKIELAGWGSFNLEDPGNTLELITDLSVQNASIIIRPRPDVARIHGDDFLLSGFKLSIHVDGVENSNLSERNLCLIFKSKNRSLFQVYNTFKPAACENLTDQGDNQSKTD